MSDVNLLIFGCGVSFVAVAGAYVYLRESYMQEEPERETETRGTEVDQKPLQDVA